MIVRDVALQTNGNIYKAQQEWSTIPQSRFDLAPDLWVEKLPSRLFWEIYDHTEPKGKWRGDAQPVKQFAQLYTFVREVPSAIAMDLNWDRDNRLHTCIALSRVVHPTTVNYGAAARVTYGEDGNLLEIVPGPVKGHHSEAFLSASETRDWLVVDELEELAVLLQKYSWPALPERVKRALWTYDYAASDYFIDTRWTLLSSAVEALVHTRQRESTAQFVDGLIKLASDVGAGAITPDDANRIYDLRSSLAHGQGLPQISKEEDRLYVLMQTVLRLTLKQAILDPTYAEKFRSNKAVRGHLVEPKPPKDRSSYKPRAVRGTRDLLPPETALWNFVESAVRDVFRAYNFQEIRTPIFESTELFARGVGEETDIVAKEMYTWEDRGRAESDKGQSLTLRPEATAGIVRAYIEHKLGDRGLNKLYCIGPMFRRERPQKGRYRQFYQIDAEIIGPPSAGSESPARDAEVLEMLATLLDRLGIVGWNLELNSVGCPSDRAAFNEALRKALEPVVSKMCVDCQRRAVTNPLRVFDCKVPEDQPIIDTLPRISQFLDEGCRKHFEAVQEILTKVGVPFSLNDRLVRGLDYYTRTAFEFTHGALGAQNAILGGGRYDGLSEALGGPAAPGIGFAIGEDRLVMSRQESAESVLQKPAVYVAPLGAGMNGEAARLARELRRHDLVVDLGDESFRLKKSFEAATKAGAKYILIVGENEMKADAFALKNLTTGEQISVPRAELAQRIQE
jgi:histidyl-tRNA synthetase